MTSLDKEYELERNVRGQSMPLPLPSSGNSLSRRSSTSEVIHIGTGSTTNSGRRKPPRNESVPAFYYDYDQGEEAILSLKSPSVTVSPQQESGSAVHESNSAHMLYLSMACSIQISDSSIHYFRPPLIEKVKT